MAPTRNQASAQSVHPLLRNEGNGWIWGCGIGCGIFILVAAVASVAGYFMVQQAMEQGSAVVRETIQEQYTDLKADGKIPEAHEELYDRFFACLMNEEAGFTVLGLGMAVFESTLEDGEVSEEEAAFIQDFVTFLEESPNPGFIAMGEFMEDHPEFADVMNQVNIRVDEGVGDEEDVIILAPEDVDALEEEAPAAEDSAVSDEVEAEAVEPEEAEPAASL